MATVNLTTVPIGRRRIRASLGLSLLALSALSSLVLAPGELQARTFKPIRLLGERIDAGATTSAQARQRLMAAAAKARGQGRATVHALIQLDGVPDATQRQSLRQANVHLQHYVPDSAWIVTIPAADPLAVESLPQVRWLGSWEGERKLQQRVREGRWNPWAIHPSEGKVMLFVQLHADVPLTRGPALALRHGGIPMEPIVGVHGLTVWMAENDIAALADEEDVLWVEEGPPPLQATNDGVRDSMQVNAVQVSPLDGSGVRLLVFDAGLVRATHQNFDAAPGRVTTFGGSGTDDHATHVAGTAAGDGGSGGNARATGVAPAAAVFSAAYSQPGGTVLFWDNAGDIQSDYATARNIHAVDLTTVSLGSNTASNGYNCAIEGDYDVTSALVDGIVRGDNPAVGSPMVVTWAAGNERTGTASGSSKVGRCGSSYATTPPPACAKNPIHVAATNSDYDSMTTFSSWGPCDDGRLKPIVSAPGCQLGRSLGPPTQEGAVYSSTAVNDSSYGGYCGTSMATPAVAGVVALMMQEWRTQGFGGAFDRPLPALVKTLLIHTARDLGNGGPDFIYGYGEVDAAAVTDAVRDGTGLGQAGPLAWGVDAAVNAATDSFAVDVPPNTAELKATLVWDDPAAAAFAANALINDLDLRIVAPDLTVHRPWQLNPASPHLPATTGINARDNQEQVLVHNPQPGTWTIDVIGSSVPQGPQPYGLAYSTSPRTYDEVECSQSLTNGGFQSGSLSWTLSGASIVAAPAPGHGSSSLRLGSANDANHTAFQQISVPAGVARAELSFFWYMTTQEGGTYGHSWDFFYAEVRNTSNAILATLELRSDGWKTAEWMKVENLDLTPWAGQTVRLFFAATNDVILPTAFYVDGVSLVSCPALPTATPTPTATPPPTGTPTDTPTPMPTATSTNTPTPTPTNTPSITATISPTAPPTLTATMTATSTPTWTPTDTPTTTPTDTATWTPTATPTETSTQTATPTPTDSSTPTRTATSTPTSTSTITPTPTATWTPTRTTTPSDTPTHTFTDTPTTTPTDTATWTATDTPTTTPTGTATWTPTSTAAETLTQTATPAPTDSSTPTRTATSTPTSTSTITPTPTATWTLTHTPPPSDTPTRTFTATPTATATVTIPISGDAIAGAVVFWAGGQPMQNVTVDLEGASLASLQTDASGQFAFNDLGVGAWTIRPRLVGGENAAISALDAAVVLLHEEGAGPLGPLQLLACDVNGDGMVDVADAVLIVQRRVGLIARYPVAVACDSDWGFFPVPTPVAGGQSTLPQPGAVACQPGQIEYGALNGQALGQSFLAILFGDCTGSWRPQP